MFLSYRSIDFKHFYRYNINTPNGISNQDGKPLQALPRWFFH
jgi:hypothetical protein